MDLVSLLLLDLPSSTIYLNICVILNFQDNFRCQLKTFLFAQYWRWHLSPLETHVPVRSINLLLADCTATQYDRLLASSCCPSVCLSVTLCIVALRVGVRGYKLHQRVPCRHVPICPFRHFCCRMYRLATKCTTWTHAFIRLQKARLVCQQWHTQRSVPWTVQCRCSRGVRAAGALADADLQ